MSEAETPEVKPVEAPENAEDLTPERDGGVLKEILKAGEDGDSPLPGDKVSVHYVGTLASDGSQFDSSRDRGEKFEFSLGKGEVIKAWDVGVASMKKGELCRLFCRSDYAYGEAGAPPNIPPAATLVFEVELFSWTGEDLSSAKDGGIIRRVMVPGEGTATPNEGALVDVHIKGSVNGSVFDERDIKFNLGEGGEVNIPEGLEKAIEKFKKNEKSLIKLIPKYTFGSAGKPDIGIPPGADVEYEVTLNDFEKVKEHWEMDQEEKIEQAKMHKEKGTKYFKEEKYRMAVKQYKKVTDLLSYDSGLDDAKKEENHALKLAGELNLAAAYLKLKDWSHARQHASTALEQDSSNVKAYFRRAQALQQLGDPEAALQDYEKCLSLDPSNSAAKKQLVACRDVIKKQKQMEKQIYSGMFDKFARSDANRLARAQKNGVLKDGVGEWDDDEKSADGDGKKEGPEGDLSDVKLLSSGDQIKGEEFMNTNTS